MPVGAAIRVRLVLFGAFVVCGSGRAGGGRSRGLSELWVGPDFEMEVGVLRAWAVEVSYSWLKGRPCAAGLVFWKEVF